MNAVELYTLCAQSGISLSVEGDQLRVASQVGDIPDAIKALLREHKQAMLELLGAHASPRGPLPGMADGPVLSYAQQRLWFQQLYDEHNAVYNIPLVLESEQPLDEGAVRASLRWLVARHEPLRTAIRNERGVAAAFLLPADRF